MKFYKKSFVVNVRSFVHYWVEVEFPAPSPGKVASPSYPIPMVARDTFPLKEEKIRRICEKHRNFVFFNSLKELKELWSQSPLKKFMAAGEKKSLQEEAGGSLSWGLLKSRVGHPSLKTYDAFNGSYFDIIRVKFDLSPSGESK